jgi:CTP:molybdopterin cytidylyltransferase MocA
MIPPTSPAGLLLGAGAGRRIGRPKALLRDERGVPFLDRAVGTLLEAGCATVTVVLGAAADEARLLLDEAGWSADPAVGVVVAEDWDEGMGASLRRGLTALGEGTAETALVMLVDLPDVHAGVLRRVLDRAGPVPRAALVRATYGGRPGHPVLLGRGHWAGVVATARGDQGAREYLTAHPPEPCECGDLAAGRDVDRPEDLPGGEAGQG